jgi:subtilisin family serine protease
MTHRILILALALALPFQALALTPNDGLIGNQWYLDTIEAKQAWETTQGNAGVIVAVLDSGVDIDHEDLISNIYWNPGEIAGDFIDNDGNGYVDDINGWDFYSDDANPRPEITGEPTDIGVHHGTVIAGLIGAKGNNNKGVVGVNWNVSILPVRVLNTEGDGTFDTIVNGIDYAVAQGADVINLSFVGEFDSESLRTAIENAHNNGVVVIAALGNLEGGRDLDVDPLYPACSSWDDNRNLVIGVSATNPADERASFSNYGRNCADIAAPGEGIFTTQNSAAGLGLYGGGWSGTSLAAPLVAGAAALIRSAHPNMSPSNILSSLQVSVDQTVGLNPKGQRGTLGAGRLNIRRALEAAANVSEDNPVVAVPPITTPVSTTPSAIANFSRPFAIGAGIGDSGAVETSEGVISSGQIWYPYGESYSGGVRVAVGQLDSDPGYEIITAPGPGGGPHIKIFNEHGQLEDEFFAYDMDFRGGVAVAASDVDGDGIDEILTAPGVGVEPVVKFHRKSGALMNTIPLGDEGWGNLIISSGDLDGDGADDVVVTDDTGDSRVFVYRIYGTQQTSFLAYAPNILGEVHTDVWEGADGKRYVVTRMKNNLDPYIRFFTYIGAFVDQFDPAADPGDNGDIAIWEAYDEQDPIIMTSELLDTPDIYGYDRNGNLSSTQLFLEHSYSVPVNLGQ